MSWADGPFRVARYDGFKVLSPKAGKYNNQVWQLEGRDDGTFDGTKYNAVTIVNLPIVIEHNGDFHLVAL
ncbi:MAG TPA: hypothetical protein DCG33_01515 [Prevotellaceae bacterium]|nr:hypothetical protein [Prevotellaceae bacterium]